MARFERCPRAATPRPRSCTLFPYTTLFRSGGEAFFPLSMKQIEAAYDKIVAQIRAQYTLGYVSSSAQKDGRWRKVEIRSEEHTSELQSQSKLVCRLLLEKKNRAADDPGGPR